MAKKTTVVEAAKLNILVNIIAWLLNHARKKDIMVKVDKALDIKFGKSRSERVQDSMCRLFKEWIEELLEDREEDLVKFVEEWHMEVMQK
jgi:hypothetical protein